MAETCIVCLGDLVDATYSCATPTAQDVGRCLLKHDEKPRLVKKSDHHIVARLLPCSHKLHHECLKPWVERANSCPICRSNFNVVELLTSIEGPVISSYAVEDKCQEAEIDAFMLVEDEEYQDIEQCFICNEFHGGLFVLCDGCNGAFHLPCVGLESAPLGNWLCRECVENPSLQVNASPSHSPTRQVPRLLHRRAGNRPATEWDRVWQHVFNRLNFDLDFPFDEDETVRRRYSENRELHEWERRLRIAAEQGNGQRFRDAAASILGRHASHDREAASPPEPESQEELRAWNAFEHARSLQDHHSGNGRRKRKSPIVSPVEPFHAPEPKLKRPRTKRALESHESVESNTDPSTSNRHPETGRYIGKGCGDNLGGPTFLQSLLKEVESCPLSEPDNGSHLSNTMLDGDHVLSPQLLSPDTSPTDSNVPMSRAGTPPPLSIPRPISPPPLTSIISPVFPRAPSFSALSLNDDARKEVDNTDSLQSRQLKKGAISPRSKSPGFNKASKDRTNISFSTKSEIQRVVTSALKPLYQKQEVTKEQYTDINKEVSRLLYDKVDAKLLTDECEREKWQKVAAQEVENTIKAMRLTDSGSDRIRASST